MEEEPGSGWEMREWERGCVRERGEQKNRKSRMKRQTKK